MNILPILGSINNLDRTRSRALENTIIELPHRLLVLGLQIRNSAEVIHIHGRKEPASTAQTGQIRRRLQQTTQLALRRRVLRTAIESLQGTSTIHQGTISSTRCGDTDIRNICHIILDPVDIPRGVEIGDIYMAEEILQGGSSFFAAFLQPFGLVRGELRSTSHGGSTSRTVDLGGNIAIWGIRKRPTRDIRYIKIVLGTLGGSDCACWRLERVSQNKNNLAKIDTAWRRKTREKDSPGKKPANADKLKINDTGFIMINKHLHFQVQ